MIIEISVDTFFLLYTDFLDYNLVIRISNLNKVIVY